MSVNIQQASQSSLQDFKLVGRLGSGSFGTVYKVLRKVDKCYYVLKQINLGGMDASQQQEAIKEVNIMARLDNEYCVRYYDSFLDEGKLNIVMEYCDRGDLQRLIRAQKSKPLKENIVWELFIKMALGLRYLHQERILHRDIKSANVFLCKGNGLKIGDLGVARVLGTNTHFAKTCVGTPYYLSPELCTGNPYNAKSDVWALGCVLYEMCTLKHPFDASNQGALILKIVSGKYQRVPATYSKPLRKLVDKMLTRDHKQRPSITQILMSRAVVEKSKEVGVPLPRDILDGAAKHDERVIIAARQRAAQRAAERAARSKVESEATRHATRRRPSEGGITGTSILPRTTSGSSTHAPSTGGGDHGTDNLLRGNVRGGRVRRGGMQRRPRVKQLPRGSPAAVRRSTSSSGASPAATKRRPTSASRIKRGTSASGASAAAAAAEVADLPINVAPAVRRGKSKAGRRTVAQLQMAASGTLPGRMDVGSGGGRGDVDVDGAGAALARARLETPDDDIRRAVDAQFERDLHQPAHGGKEAEHVAMNVRVDDGEGGMRDTIIRAPADFWGPVVPEEAVVAAVQHESVADERRSLPQSGTGRAHEVSLDVLEVSHGVDDEDLEEADDLDPSTFSDPDDDFEEDAAFLHPGAFFSVADGQVSRPADTPAAERAVRDAEGGGGKREEVARGTGGAAAARAGASAGAGAASNATPSARTAGAGGGLYDAPDRIAELLDEQAQLRAQISHLRVKCADSVEQEVIDRICNATSRLVMEEDEELQAALHSANPVDIYALIKLLFCVNGLRESEAQMEEAMAAAYE